MEDYERFSIQSSNPFAGGPGDIYFRMRVAMGRSTEVITCGMKGDSEKHAVTGKSLLDEIVRFMDDGAGCSREHVGCDCSCDV